MRLGLILFLLSTFYFHLALAGRVTLAWDPNSEPDLAGYLVYVGRASRAYFKTYSPGNVTVATITGLRSRATYYFAATAYDTEGNESDYSNEVIYTVP